MPEEKKSKKQVSSSKDTSKKPKENIVTPKQTTTKKPSNKTTASKKQTTKKKETQIKISESDKTVFPYDQFPVKIIHKDGKDLKETKICYFQSEHYAQKYITRCKFKKTDYQLSLIHI